jgi:hypothetical protein
MQHTLRRITTTRPYPDHPCPLAPRTQTPRPEQPTRQRRMQPPLARPGPPLGLIKNILRIPTLGYRRILCIGFRAVQGGICGASRKLAGRVYG